MQKWIAIWLASVVAGAVLISVAMSAQTRRPEGECRILSGPDLGFRVEGTDMSGKPTGTFMIREGGRWVEIGASEGIRRVR